MPFNGAGVYSPVAAPDFPAVPATTIKSSQYNNQINDMATALGLCVTRDGQSPATANLPMGGFRHTGVSKGVAATDYVRVDQLADGSLTIEAQTVDHVLTLAEGGTGATTASAARTSLSAAQSGANSDITSLTGTATNDSAAAGKIGEYASSTVAAGSAVALTSGIAANVTTLALDPGDWDVSGHVSFKPAGTTSITAIVGSVSQASAAQDDSNRFVLRGAPYVPGSDCAGATLTQRISIAVPTTLYLVATAVFTISTMASYGTIRARRSR
jgi:hypothetical protein